MRCQITDAGGGRLKGIAFRAADRALGRALLDRAGAPLHLAGNLRVDRWQDRETAQLVILDGAEVRPGGG